MWCAHANMMCVCKSECVCVQRQGCVFVSIFPQGVCICIQVPHTHTHTHAQRPAEGEMVGDERGKGAVKRELWILKDFPLLRECGYTERRGEVKPENEWKNKTVS